jgi:hypothetical protein
MGGGGGTSSAQKQADANEAERQRKIAESTGAINKMFDDPARQAQYDALGNATTKFYTGDVDKQNTEAQRQLSFALARSGLSGGSEQLDKGKVLTEDYQKALLEASRRGQSAAASLKSSDEQTRQQLIAMAMGGLDATSASSEAASALRSNVEGAQADAGANSLGDLFTNLGNTYQTSQEAAAARRGQKYGYTSLYSPMFGPQASAPPPQQQPQNITYSGWPQY